MNVLMSMNVRVQASNPLGWGLARFPAGELSSVRCKAAKRSSNRVW